MRSSILSQCRDLSTEVICSVFGFELLREQGSFAVAGDKIFVFAVSLGKEVTIVLFRMYERSSDNRCCFEVDSVPDVAKSQM